MEKIPKYDGAGKRHGVGATCSVLLKYLHPAKYISEIFPNLTNKDRLENCIQYRQEVRKVNKKEQVVILLRHDDHPEQELYAVWRWINIDDEESPEHVFEQEDAVVSINEVNNEIPEESE